MRANGIVPLAVKQTRHEVHGGNLGVRDLVTDGIPTPIETASDGQALSRGRLRDQLHDRLVVAQRFAAPVRGDEGEQPVFDLVPFARARREMADANGKSGPRPPALQLQLPEPQALAIAAAAVRRDQQVRALGYSRRPSARHHPRMDATANAPVSWSVPTFTKPVLRPRS